MALLSAVAIFLLLMPALPVVFAVPLGGSPALRAAANTAPATALSQAQIDDITPIALFSQAAYCSTASILA